MMLGTVLATLKVVGQAGFPGPPPGRCCARSRAPRETRCRPPSPGAQLRGAVAVSPVRLADRIAGASRWSVAEVRITGSVTIGPVDRLGWSGSCRRRRTRRSTRTPAARKRTPAATR